MKKETREERTARQTAEFYARMKARRERDAQREQRQQKPPKQKKQSTASIRAEARAAERTRWNDYRSLVRKLTELQPLHLLPGIELRGQQFHIDHKISIRFAFDEGIPAEECAALDNLQIIPWRENFRKGNSCYTSLSARRLSMTATGACDSRKPLSWGCESHLRTAA